MGYSWSFIQSQDASKHNFGIAPLDKDLIIEDVKKLRPLCDLLIVSVHWSFERETYPIPYQRNMAHSCINNGADIIYGHHPHVLQGYEIYKNKHIFYSLGNFIFPEYGILKNYPQDQKETVIVKMQYHNSECKINCMTPVSLKNNQQLVEGDNAASILKKLQKRSAGFLLTSKEYEIFYKKNRLRQDLPVLKSGACWDQFQLWWWNYKKRLYYIFVKILSFLGIKELVKKLLV